MGNYSKGYECFNILDKESNWSKAIYAYAKVRSPRRIFWCAELVSSSLLLRSGGHALWGRSRSRKGYGDYEERSRLDAKDCGKECSHGGNTQRHFIASCLVTYFLIPWSEIRRSSSPKVYRTEQSSSFTRNWTSLRPQLYWTLTSFCLVRNPSGSSQYFAIGVASGERSSFVWKGRWILGRWGLSTCVDDRQK